MAHLKDTKVGQHFDNRFNQFVWIILVFVFTAGGSWVATQKDIKTNTLFGQETRIIIVEHIDDTKGDPLTEMQLQNKVENIEDDVKDHNVKIDKHDTMLTQHDKDLAVQKVQYDNIIKKLDELIKKGD